MKDQVFYFSPNKVVGISDNELFKQTNKNTEIITEPLDIKTFIREIDIIPEWTPEDKRKCIEKVLIGFGIWKVGV